MNKIIIIMAVMLSALTGCTKEQNITFTAQIESLDDKHMMVSTHDDIGFDKASVDVSQAKIKEELSVGDRVEVTIEPEIRESYPVQVSATKVERVKAKYKKITAKEAKEMMNEGKYGTILDVRTLEEYNKGHIESATLLPDYELKDKAETMLYDKEEIILIYCRSGNRSATAAKQLIDMGYTNVYDFGGIIDWPYEVVEE